MLSCFVVLCVAHNISGKLPYGKIIVIAGNNRTIVRSLAAHDIINNVRSVSEIGFFFFFRSPQTRSTIAGNSSPVVAPLALSVSNPGIVPLVPASDAVKENVGTAPALPSPAAILPDQPCIESGVSLPITITTLLLGRNLKTVIFIIKKKSLFPKA